MHGAGISSDSDNEFSIESYICYYRDRRRGGSASISTITQRTRFLYTPRVHFPIAIKGIGAELTGRNGNDSLPPKLVVNVVVSFYFHGDVLTRERGIAIAELTVIIIPPRVH